LFRYDPAALNSGSVQRDGKRRDKGRGASRRTWPCACRNTLCDVRPGAGSRPVDAPTEARNPAEIELPDVPLTYDNARAMHTYAPAEAPEQARRRGLAGSRGERMES